MLNEEREGKIVSSVSVVAICVCLIVETLVMKRHAQLFSMKMTSLGVFLLTTRILIAPVKRVYSVNTYLLFSTIPRGSERSQ